MLCEVLEVEIEVDCEVELVLVETLELVLDVLKLVDWLVLDVDVL